MYLATCCFEMQFVLNAVCFEWFDMFALLHFILTFAKPTCIYLPTIGTNFLVWLYFGLSTFDWPFFCCFSIAWRFSMLYICFRAFSHKRFGLKRTCRFDTLHLIFFYLWSLRLFFDLPLSKLVETALQRKYSCYFLFFCIWFSIYVQTDEPKMALYKHFKYIFLIVSENCCTSCVCGNPNLHYGNLFC